MSRTMTVSESTTIAATPETVYDLVSDPTLMGRWSPENRGATVSGDTDPRVGMSFLGHNKRGPMRWTTECEVTAAEPGQRFAFLVRAWGLREPWLRLPIASWEYRLEQAEGGTRVTETWTDERRSWPDWAATAFDKIATGGHTFADFNRRNIETSLRRLKQAVEQSATSW